MKAVAAAAAAAAGANVKAAMAAAAAAAVVAADKTSVAAAAAATTATAAAMVRAAAALTPTACQLQRCQNADRNVTIEHQAFDIRLFSAFCRLSSFFFDRQQNKLLRGKKTDAHEIWLYKLRSCLTSPLIMTFM